MIFRKGGTSPAGLLIGALVAAGALVAPLSAAGESNGSIRVSFLGDIIMHIPVKSCAMVNNRADGKKTGSLNNRGFDYLFERISKTFEDSDVVAGNMEFPVSPPFTSQPFLFNSPPEALAAMKKAGVNLVTIANNHTLDQGRRGLLDTMRFLERNGIDFIGVHVSEEKARAGYVFEKGGLRVGFLACTGVFNVGSRRGRGFYINDFNDRARTGADIADLKKRCDYLVMIAHAGTEYDNAPSGKDAALMRQYLEAGADIIIGHHPHVLQRIDRYVTKDGRAATIFYSLGNFISNQSSAGTRESVIVRLTLARKNGRVKEGIEIIPVRTSNEPSWKGGRRHRDIQVVPAAEELRELMGKREGMMNDAGKQALEKKIADLKALIGRVRRALFQENKFEDIKFPAEE